VSVPTGVVMKLMRPLFKHGCNATCDNFFTSLDLAVRLAKEKCSIVGTIRQNHRELSQAAKAKQQLHETTLFKTPTLSTSVTLTWYQYKKAKPVIILSTLHPDIEVSSENNTKKKPETVLFYNKTKAGVNVVDQMARKYYVKAASRRWSAHVFYNVIDLAIINSWVLYKKTCRSRLVVVSTCNAQLKSFVEHHQTTNDELAEREQEPPTKKRRTCSTSKCRNRIILICCTCKEAICGKCSTKVSEMCQVIATEIKNEF